jgi:hypothetical protein
MSAICRKDFQFAEKGAATGPAFTSGGGLTETVAPAYPNPLEQWRREHHFARGQRRPAAAQSSLPTCSNRAFAVNLQQEKEKAPLGRRNWLI